MQAMSSGIIRSLGISKFLDWEVLDAGGEVVFGFACGVGQMKFSSFGQRSGNVLNVVLVLLEIGYLVHFLDSLERKKPYKF